MGKIKNDLSIRLFYLIFHELSAAEQFDCFCYLIHMILPAFYGFMITENHTVVHKKLRMECVFQPEVQKILQAFVILYGFCCIWG